MNKSRQLSLINMIVNFILIGLEAAGMYFFAKTQTFDVNSLRYYTVLTVFVTSLGAALMIWANIVSFIKKRDCTPRLFYTIRYLSAVMSLITIVTVAAILVPKEGAGSLISLDGGFVFLHFVCPIVSVLQFMCFEIEPKAKFKKTFEPFIGTILYAIGIISALFAIKATQGVEAAKTFAPYFFFLITPELSADYLLNIGVAASVLVIAYVAAVLLWLLNRMFHAIFVGEEYIPASALKTPVKGTSKGKKKTAAAPAAPVKSGNAFTSYLKKKVAFGDGSTVVSGPVYHISYHDRRLHTWKVKTENAGRALKVFPTQKEAIDFANACVRKSGGSIRVHSMLGKIRKE
ncbi:MAG: DUF2188 domain-containing protein [Bacilli bacterium]|nr:DUF2188 domain-containing protein [Bacilli bacterium]